MAYGMFITFKFWIMTLETFIAEMECDECGLMQPHEITFLGLDPIKQIITFLAICLTCKGYSEEEDEGEYMGWECECSYDDWLDFCPQQDELLN